MKKREMNFKERFRGITGKVGSLLDRYYASTPPYRLSGWDKIIGLLLAAFFFTVYLYTCSHSPNIAGDSPELIAGSYTLGILHPPGYPLYTLVGYVFSHIPLGDVAFRVNFMSVLFHSLTLLILFCSLIKLTRSKAASAIAVSILGFSSLFWFYSQVAEVFPLNDLLVVLLIYVAIRVREEWISGNETGSLRRFVLLSFLAGLSLTHHQTIIIIFPALLLFTPYPLLSVLKKPKWLLVCITVFLCGLLPYLYLPIRASQNPYINFLNPSTLKNFRLVVTRAYYGTSRLWIGPAADHSLDMIFNFLQGLNSQVKFLGLLLGITGMFHAARKRIGDFLPLFTAYFLAAIVFPIMANVKVDNPFLRATLERFYLLPTIIFIYFIAMGIGVVISLARQWLSKLDARQELKRGLLWVFILLLALAFLYPAHNTARDVNLRYDVVGEGYIENLLNSVNNDDVIFTTGDVPIFLMEYYDTVVKGEKEPTIIIYNFLSQPWYIPHLRKYYPDLNVPSAEEVLIAVEEGKKDIRDIVLEYIVSNNPQVGNFYAIMVPKIGSSYQSIPDKLAFIILPTDEEIDLNAYLEEQLEYWGKLNRDGLVFGFYSPNRREADLLSQYPNYPYQVGEYLRISGNLEMAIEFYSIAYNIYPSPDYLRAIADVLLQLDRPEEAYFMLESYINSGGLSNQQIWQALLDMEDILAEGGFNDAE